MDRRTRIAFFVTAIVIAVVALIVLRPPDEEEAASPEGVARETATATDGAQDDPSPTLTPEPLPLLTAEKVRRIEVEQGELVHFEARSAESDEVHVHGYDISKAIPAGEKVRVSFKADITGIFEIELERAGALIGELEVRP